MNLQGGWRYDKKAPDGPALVSPDRERFGPFDPLTCGRSPSCEAAG